MPGNTYIELSFKDTFATKCLFLLEGQALKCNVINNTEREVVLGLRQSEVVIDADNHCWRRIAGTKTIATPNDKRTIFNIVESFLYIKIERFALCARLFRAVENGNALACLGNSCEQMLCAERTIEVHTYHADLAALFYEVVDSFATSFRN